MAMPVRQSGSLCRPTRSLASACAFASSQRVRTHHAQYTVARQSSPPTGQKSVPPPPRADPRQSISRQRTSERRPLQPSTESDIYLPRRLLLNKQVITRTTGKQLGYVAQLYVDPQRLEVVSMDLKPDWLSIGSGADSSILLSALRQIGDVVLVHDESSLEEGAALGSTWGAVKLVGMSVETEDGQILGKVREFTFSPDSGRIERIQFDRFGLPALSDSVVSVFGLPAQDVVRVEFSRLLIQKNPRIVKESEGILDKATEALFAIKAPDEDDDYARRYEEWDRKHGAAYRQYSGEEPPARQTAVMPAVQQMAQLPSPQMEFRKRLMTQPYREPERVAAREGVRDARRVSQSMPETQYRTATQLAQRSRAPERLQGPRREQPQPQQPIFSPEQVSSPVQYASRPPGIPIVERKQTPAYRRQDVDGRYGPGPGLSPRHEPSTRLNDKDSGRTGSPSGQVSDRRPPFEEFLQAEEAAANSARQ